MMCVHDKKYSISFLSSFLQTTQVHFPKCMGKQKREERDNEEDKIV